MMTWIEAGLYGMAGGALPEILALYNLRHVNEGEKPQWVKSYFYWCITVVMIFLGGGTVLLYQKIGINVNEFMAVHLGVATPLLITTALKEKPKVD